MSDKFYIRFFTGVLALTGLLLVGIGMRDYQARQAVSALKERYLQIEQLRGQIIHDDEIMTMSARMAAATGDRSWEAQYRAVEPKMKEAIQEAMTVSPEIYRKEEDRAGSGKIKLLKMEDTAFALIRQKQNKEAMDLLFGKEYELQRNDYERGIEQLNAYLKKQMDAALAVENSKAYLSQVSFITVSILLLLSWLVLLCILRGAQNALIESNHRLDELNKNLDLKVRERTSRLTEALDELQRSHRDLQKAQAQLLQSEKFSAIGQLAAGIAHEINNPIGFINCNLQTLDKYLAHYRPLLSFVQNLVKAINDKNQEKLFQLLSHWEKTRHEINFKFIEGDIGNLIKESREGTEHMRRIVADLCDFASPDKGKEEALNVEALMESILNIVWNEIKYKAQLRKNYGTVPSIVGNPQKIGQVFVNLLTNAAHAIQGKGFITIKTYTKDHQVCIEIGDTGCGIPPEHYTKIFDPFFTTQPVGQGTGLGLSSSYDIVRKSGGDITFSSQVGKGSVFTVMLPAACVPAQKQLLGEGI